MLPLAERLRPKTLDEYIGQKHLVGEGAILRQMIESGNIASFILWGPPGVGKTTLARIIAHQLQRPFYTLSAVTSGVKEVRDVIDKAKRTSVMNSGLFAPADSRSPILFIDEIHRFSKSQQDSLLGAVEEGTITLIGATTENPSFEVITPLLSRCQVYVLKSLEKADLLELLDRAMTQDEYIRSLGITVKETESILRYSGGDARKLLNIIELVSNSGVKVIDNETVTKQLQQNPVAYDKDGEMHYDIISAFIKSIRGSDPRTDDRRRRGPEVYRPAVGHLRERGHRVGESECNAGSQCVFRRTDKNRLAGRTNPLSRSHYLFSHKPKEQLRHISYRRCPWRSTRNRQSARTSAPEKCANESDERAWLLGRIQICT